MTHKEILEKAIQKAIEGGWSAKLNDDLDWWEDDHKAWFDGSLGEWGGHVYPESVVHELIFNHDFAKALWGDSPFPHHYEHPDGETNQPLRPVNIPYYYWHLQQMVVADDPVKYLGENI